MGFYLIKSSCSCDVFRQNISYYFTISHIQMMYFDHVHPQTHPISLYSGTPKTSSLFLLYIFLFELLFEVIFLLFWGGENYRVYLALAVRILTDLDGLTLCS